MKRGFTMIEVVVAIGIFALASVAISQSFMGGLISLERFGFIDTRDESLHAVLRQVLSADKRKEMELGGNLQTLESGDVKWTVEINETELAHLYQVDIHMRFSDDQGKNRPKEFSEQVYTYRAEWETERDQGQDSLVEKDDNRSSDRKGRNGRRT